MRKSRITHVFDLINLGESDYQKQIVQNFVSDLLQDVLINIGKNHERPDFDATMYSYREPDFKMIKTFECQATPTMLLKFNAMFRWKYDYLTEEYSELEVIEIIAPRIEYLKCKFMLDDYLDPSGVRKAIMHSANGIAVENWELLSGVSRP